MKTPKFYTFILIFAALGTLSAQPLNWQGFQAIYDSNIGNTLTVDEVLTDVNGNVYVSGNNLFDLTVIDTVLLDDPAVSTYKQFLAKFTPDGELIWAQQEYLNDNNTQIAIDSLSRIHVAARINANQEYDVGDSTLLYENGSLYHAVYDQNRELLYAHQIDAGPNSFIIDIAATADNGAVILVTIGEQITLFDASFNRADVVPALDQFGGFYFLLKYDADGQLEWYHKMSARQNWFAHHLRTNQNGDIILAGEYHEYFKLNEAEINTIEELGTSDIYVATFSAEGEVLGLASYGSLRGDKCNDVFVDQNNDIYLAGKTGGGLTVFGDQSQEVAFQSPFYVKLKPDLGVDDLRIETFESDGNSEALSVVVDESQNVIVGGTYFGEQAVIGGVPLSVNVDQKKEAYLAQYDNNGNFCCVTTAGGQGDDQVVDLAIVDGSRVFTVGTYQVFLHIEGQVYVVNNEFSLGTEIFLSHITYSPLTAVFAPDGTDIKLSMYPNPVADFLSVTWQPQTESGDAWTVVLYDAQGQGLRSLEVAPSAAQLRIPVADLPKGWYVVQIRDRVGNTFSRKISVQ